MRTKHEEKQRAALRIRPAGSLNARGRATHRSAGSAGRLRRILADKKAGMDLKGQNILAERRIRAERKAGKLLKEYGQGQRRSYKTR